MRKTTARTTTKTITTGHTAGNGDEAGVKEEEEEQKDKKKKEGARGKNGMAAAAEAHVRQRRGSSYLTVKCHAYIQEERDCH